MKSWLITFRIFWTKARFANVQFIYKSVRKPSQSVANELAIHYWKYNWQLHHKNSAYLSIPDRFVVVSETTQGAVPGNLPIPTGKFHPQTSYTQSGNLPAH